MGGKVDVVPSLVFVQEDNRLLLGEPVRTQRLGVGQPERLFQGFKRDLAADYRPPARQINGHTYTFESISEFFLQQLWQQVVAQQLQPNRVIFTVPVGAFERYLNWFQDVAQRLNFPAFQIVDESTAAAIGYGVQQPSAIVLVMDFGGGTLDLSLVRVLATGTGKKGLKAEVLAKSDAYIGGVDIDTWIVEDYLRKVGSSRSAVKQSSWQNLLDAAERLKIKLSTATEIVKENWFDEENFSSHELQLTEQEFAEILESRQLLKQVRQALDEVLAIAHSKGIRNTEIEQVLLVGGSCLIPAVQQLVISYFGQQRVKLDKCFEAVAHGALTLAQIVGVDDYLRHCYAIRLWDSYTKTHFYYSLFDKGTRYPCQRSQPLTLQVATDGQTEIRLEIGELREVAPVEVIYNAKGGMMTNQLPKQTEFCLLESQQQQVNVVHFAPQGQIGVDRIELSLEVNEQRALVVNVKDLLAQRVLIERVAMVANPQQPGMQDDVSVSQTPPTSGAVLGGLAGAKRRMGIPAATIINSSETSNSALESNPTLDNAQPVQPTETWLALACRYNLKQHTNAVTSVAISPDGHSIASGSRDKTIRLWHTDTGALLHTLIAHTDAVSCIAISPDGKLLASGSQDKTVKLWHVRTGEWLRTLTDHAEPIFSVAFSPDGQILASGGWEQTITLRRLYTKSLPRRFSSHPSGVAAVAFSPDGQIFVSCGDNTIKLWHLSTGQLLHTLSGHSDLVVAIAISPDGQILASAGGMNDRTIKLWHLGTGQLMHTLSGPTSDVMSLAISKDGQILAGGSYKAIHLWHLGTGEQLCTLSGHPDPVLSVAFGSDGQTLVSGGADGTVKVWQSKVKS